MARKGHEPMTRDGQTFAPWSLSDVDALNAYQGRGDMHPFTCPADGNYGSHKHSDRRILLATEKGWVCEMCPYTQNWAHTFMKEPMDA